MNDNANAITETVQGDAHRDSIGQDGATVAATATAGESDHEVELYKAAAALHAARQALDTAERIHRQGKSRHRKCSDLHSNCLSTRSFVEVQVYARPKNGQRASGCRRAYFFIKGRRAQKGADKLG